MPLVLAVLVFGSVSMITFVVSQIAVGRVDIRRRSITSTPLIEGVDNTSRVPGYAEKLIATTILQRVGKIISPTDVESYSLARKEMIKAGFFSPGAVAVYHGTRIVLGLGLPSVFAITAGLLPFTLSSTATIATIVCLAALGFVLPSFYVQRRQKKMRTEFRSGFPDFMDLLVVCVESGLALQPALARICQEMAYANPRLSANLHLVNLELRAGGSLADALRNLTQRVDIEEAYSLASLLKQSEELGTSLGSALRVYSEEMRDKRFMRAETMAQALPVKIVLPVSFCFFPVILVVLFLPLLIRIKEILLH